MPVWFVFGVQSSASRTVPSGVTDADGDATALADGPVATDAAGEGVAMGPTVGAAVVADEPHAVTANSTAQASASAASRGIDGMDAGHRVSVVEHAKRRLRDTGTASARVDGPASFAGTSRIRFRGSVAVATLSAREALPGGDIRLSRDGTSSDRPPRSGHTADDGAASSAHARLRTTVAFTGGV